MIVPQNYYDFSAAPMDLTPDVPARSSPISAPRQFKRIFHSPIKTMVFKPSGNFGKAQVRPNDPMVM
ncbi:MAG: hypothetical protein JSR46_07795 [Verrucomicrobia bacterium]|nr:hypothetical protein [Verrucomicrobiota bacterium]